MSQIHFRKKCLPFRSDGIHSQNNNIIHNFYRIYNLSRYELKDRLKLPYRLFICFSNYLYAYLCFCVSQISRPKLNSALRRTVVYIFVLFVCYKATERNNGSYHIWQICMEPHKKTSDGGRFCYKLLFCSICIKFFFIYMKNNTLKN